MNSPVVHVILGMPFFVWKDEGEGIHHSWSRVWCNIMLKESNHK
jgi:hypothetical protein